jgi:hypothetical protein
MQRQQIGRAAWLVGGSIDAGSHMRNTLASAGQGGMPQMIDQVAMHVGYNVQELQKEYAGVEAQIAQLEDRIRSRNGGVLPAGLESLADSALQERHRKLNDQIATSNPAEMLRTVHTDGVQLRHMVDARGMPVGTQGMVSAPIRYEVRLPSNAGITLMVGNRAIRGTDIPLTGGEKWVRFPAEVIRGLNIGNARVLIHRPNLPDAVGTMSRTDHDNLVFNFNGAPPPPIEQEQGKKQTEEVEKKQEERKKQEEEQKEKNERPPETPKINVSPDISMFTGGRGGFTITSQNAAIDPRAAQETIVRVDGRIVRIPDTGTEPRRTTVFPSRVVLTRRPDGQVEVTGGPRSGTVRVSFQRRNSSAIIERQITVHQIDVEPQEPQTLTRASDEMVSYVVTAPDDSDQNINTRVQVDDEEAVVHQGDNETTVGPLIVERNGDSVNVRLSPNAALEHTVIFKHGLQEIRRVIHVVSLPGHNPPGVGPDLLNAVGPQQFQKALKMHNATPPQPPIPDQQ